MNDKKKTGELSKAVAHAEAELGKRIGYLDDLRSQGAALQADLRAATVNVIEKPTSISAATELVQKIREAADTRQAVTMTLEGLAGHITQAESDVEDGKAALLAARTALWEVQAKELAGAIREEAGKLAPLVAELRSVEKNLEGRPDHGITFEMDASLQNIADRAQTEAGPPPLTGPAKQAAFLEGQIAYAKQRLAAMGSSPQGGSVTAPDRTFVPGPSNYWPHPREESVRDPASDTRNHIKKLEAELARVRQIMADNK